MSTVSVIIPAYNQARYLGDAVTSALAQTHDDLEIIIVDDGSTDDTRTVAMAFADPRVRYVHQQNRGLSAARNTGIRQARGEFLTFLDSDDLFLPDKLQLLVAAMDREPRLGLVAGQAVVIDEHGYPVGEIIDRPIPIDLSELLLGNPLHVGSVLLRRDWQERVGVFDETLRSYEDWDMWLRLARVGCPMGWVALPVSLYRFHRAQMTRIGAQMTTATFAVLDKAYNTPDLPVAWQARRPDAYGRAFLRAAAQAYTNGDGETARDCMRQAVHSSPSLVADDGSLLAGIVAGWANHAKTPEPMAFLERVYEYLPDELAVLRERRGRDLGRAALQLAFEAGDRGEVTTMRARLRQVVAHDARLWLDRGVLRLWLFSLLPRGRSQPMSKQSGGPFGWNRSRAVADSTQVKAGG